MKRKNKFQYLIIIRPVWKINYIYLQIFLNSVLIVILYISYIKYLIRIYKTN